MDYIRYIKRGQVVTLPAEELLQDKRFPWTEKKVKTVRLAELYDKAGYPEYGTRARTCATWLQYGELPNGEMKLSAANFCQLRLCPMCMARRARRAVYKLSRILDKVEHDHGCKFIFLTLTVQNVDGEHLGDAYKQLLGAWNKLTQHRQFRRSVHGWFRSLETTRGDGKKKADRGYHPHIHAILAVDPAYFSSRSLYITHKEWVAKWRLALGVDYDPRVRIQVTKKKGEAVAGLAAAQEASKYPVKDDEYIDPDLPEEKAVEILRDYTVGLRGKKLTGFGGWLKEAARALDAADLDDGDLVHADEDAVREDVADLILTYNWHFGAGDYILARREINPLKLEQKEKAV